MGLVGKEEVLMKMPAFVGDNAFRTIGLSLLLMQMSFKILVETFGDFASDFYVHLGEWTKAYNELMARYQD